MITQGFPVLTDEWVAFRMLPRDQLLASVIGIMNRFDRDARQFDFDRLMSAGLRLARSSVPVPQMAGALINWADETRSEKRLGMAAALLNGLWRCPQELPLIFRDDLPRYICLIEAVPITVEADNVKQTLDMLQPHVQGATQEKIRTLKTTLDGATRR